MKEDVTRRSFLASAGKAALGAGVLGSALPAPALGRGQGSPGERINLSFQAGRSIRWDPVKETVIGDREAMQLGAYQREYRSPWKLPVYGAGEA